MREYIPLAKPNISRKDIRSVNRVLKTGKLSNGSEIMRFEESLAEYLGVKYVVSTSSATTALELAIAAQDQLSPGDEIMLPAFTFPASINSVIARGLRPIFIDIKRDSLNIDENKLEENVTMKTKAVIPVDAFGLPYNHDSIKKVCSNLNIEIIEDAACALGAQIGSENIGNSNHAVIFSFHQRKILSTGEGGVITTNLENYAKKLKLLRSHGAKFGKLYSSFEAPGYNFRFNEMAAALGSSQLDALDSHIHKLSQVAKNYRSLFAGISEIDLSATVPNEGRVYQSFVVKLPNKNLRDNAILFLRSHKIESTIGTYDLPNQPAYKEFTDGKKYPNSQEAGETTLALPIFSSMKTSDTEYVSEKLIEFIRR